MSVFYVFVDLKNINKCILSKGKLFPCTYATPFHVGPMSFRSKRGTSPYGSQPLPVLRGTDGVTTVKESLTPSQPVGDSQCDWSPTDANSQIKAWS